MFRATRVAPVLRPAVLCWAVLLAMVAAAHAGETPAPNDSADAAQNILRSAEFGGGLIVHLGCGDGRLTAALAAAENTLVHGLDADEANVEKARAYAGSLDCRNRVSIDRFGGGRLPLVDNLVNLLVAEELGDTPIDEVMRVLAPGGAACLENSGEWTTTVKPWPEEIDEWSHFLHGPDNNAVARDRAVGRPAHLQWITEPQHLRSHEHLNSLSALVSNAGRVFYMIDEGPTSSVVAPPQWRLVARDAFNGVLLWRRDLGPWEGHFRLFRSGPPDMARRLVAIGDRVYATLGYGKQVAAFDAATGKTVRTYDATEGAVEIIYHDGTLFVVVGHIDADGFAKSSRIYYPSPPPRRKGIVAIDARSGNVLWQRRDEDTAALMATTMAVKAGRLFFQNTEQLICLDADTGEEQWRAERPVFTTRLSWSAPTVVATDEVVLSADGSTGGLPSEARRGESTVSWVMSDRDIRRHPIGDVMAFDTRTGKKLWTSESLQGFCAPGDLFVIDDLVWSGALVAPGQESHNIALDLKTGEVRRRRKGGPPPMGGHARCYRNKATERFLVLGGTGIELVDVDDFSWTSDPWVRGTCQFGVLPSAGMIYVPPDSCACRANVRLHGFTAMAPARKEAEGEKGRGGEGERLVPGPASGEPLPPVRPSTSSDDWSTYRHDGARSGWTKSSVPAELHSTWRAEIGGALSSLTVGARKVFVSQIDANTVYALDVITGNVVWSHTVGGPVDSPPTLYVGHTYIGRDFGSFTKSDRSKTYPTDLCIFGCRDGHVYCLRANDGELVWRFRAAPEDRRLVAQESVESVWPVHGSVLVRDGLAWFAAGRSSYLDGGIWLYALDLATGKPVVERQLDGRATGDWPSKAGRSRTPQNTLLGTLPDILSTSDDLIFMRWTCFDTDGNPVQQRLPHLFNSTGFLDDSWWHRTYWQYGTWMRGGFGGWPQAARQAPAGRILVANDEAIFGFGRSKYDPGNPNGVHAGHVGVIKDGYQDSGHVDHPQNPMRLFCVTKPTKPGPAEYRWQTQLPHLVRAMVLADQSLIVAGPLAGNDNEGLAKLDTVQPGLWDVVSAADGRQLAGGQLPSAPVFDGMAASGGSLFIALTNGSVVCLGKNITAE